MAFNIIFYLCFFLASQQEIKNFVKILLNKSTHSFYINASFNKDNSVILPLKIDLNSLSTSVDCKFIQTFSENRIITCSDNLCYKLFYEEEICDKSLKNNCSFIIQYIYDFEKRKNISGIYIQNYFNIFNDTKSIEKNNILPIGCIENKNNEFNENINYGIFSLGGNIYSFLPHFYKENNFKESNSFFSLCLDPIEGGYLSFGNIMNKFHLNNDLPLNFKYDIKYSYYIFKINNMFFNHQNFNKEEYEAIFNMEIQYSYVKKAIIINLYNLFEKFLSEKFLEKYELDLTINNKDLDLNGICFINNNKKDSQFKEKIFALFPPLFIGIQNRFYEWNSEYYLYKKENKDKNKEEYCIGLLPNEKRIKQNEEIIELGTNFMYGHELIFNFTKKEIIVYESNCAMKSNKKKDIIIESKYDKINGYLKIIIIILVILSLFMALIICRLSKRTSLCNRFLGKKITNEEINQFFNTNYDIIQ